MGWVHWRRISQLAFFGLFVVLLAQTEYRGTNLISWPVGLFLRFDPLLALSAGLADGLWARFFLPSLLLVALTLLLGRFFCGWVCPLGTTLQAGGWLLGRAGFAPRRHAFHPLQRIKYLLLAALLLLAFLGINAVSYFDPICLAIRSWGLPLFAALDWLWRWKIGLFDRWGVPDRRSTRAEQGLSRHLFSLAPRHYEQAGVILAIFLALRC